jgi:opacity protein-like surface antigen
MLRPNSSPCLSQPPSTLCILLRSDAADQSEACVPRIPRLRKAAFVSFLTLTLAAFALAQPASAQDNSGFGGTRSFGISTSYSPDSSHILIGNAGQRRTWTAGAEYTRLLFHPTHRLRLDYEAQVLPLFLESDPTVTATVFTFGGQNFVTHQTPERVLFVTHQPVGSVLTPNGSMAPLYAYFGRQNTYAAAITPLGARLSAMPRSRLQPSLALDLGLVIADRDIPLDDCAQFNYTFAVGPGIQFFTAKRSSYRLEYVYRHVSNAGQGAQNPGVDQGVIRLTVSLHH